jgi:hypothetical protein
MKATLSLCITCVALTLLGARFLVSEDAALVSGGLRVLKFEPVAGKPDVIGGPPRLKVTQVTLAYLEKLMKEGRTIEVQNDGAIKILDPAK